MGWKIIEIENTEQINLFIGNLVFKKDNEKITIPINDIDVLLINNYKLKITIQLINALSKENVLTIICDNSYIPSSIILPIFGNYNTLKVLNNQLNWNHIWKSQTWANIIRLKIKSQIKLLKKLFNDNDYEKLNSLLNEIKEYDISNREGHASKIYFHKLFGTNFKRHNEDYINKLLNYGYTILRAYFARSIVKKGLDPRISLFHKSFHNHFALASDLMEPFRFLIDEEVFNIVNSDGVNFYRDKEKLINVFNNKIKIKNNYQFINKAIDIFVDCIINQESIIDII